MEGYYSDREEAEGYDSDSECSERETETDFLPDLDEELLLKIKRNDPSVTKISITFEEEGFADGINWVTEGWWLGRNTMLKELDFYEFQSIRDDEDDISNFEAFCRGFSHNKSIQCLYIDGVSNDALMTDHLPRFIINSYSKNLRRLHLSDCCDSPDHIRKLIDALSFPKTMAKFNMNVNAGEREYKLDKRSRLQQFLFCSKQLNDNLAGELIEALRYHKNLLKIELNFMDGKIGRIGCNALMNLLEDPTMKLKILEMCANNLDDECLALIGKGLTKNTTLRKINLESNGCLADSVKMTPAGWKSFFGHLIESNCNLELVNVSCNDIGDEVVVFINALPTFPTLRTLDIGRNEFTVPAWDALSIYLQSSNCTLETLDLCDSGLSNTTLLTLTNALRQNLTLMKLSIGSNRIDTQETWHSFFSLLESTKNTLVDISCQHCGISSEGIQSIRWEMVELKALALGWNRIGDEGLGALCRICNTLETLDLRGNEVIGTEAWLDFANVLQDSRCSLKELSLQIENGSEEEIFSAIENNLALNKSLESLCFNKYSYVNRESFASREWASFANTLCNKSSIKDTYESNHTLSQVFTIYQMEILNEAGGAARRVARCLEWNKNSNKFQVARQKIIHTHFHGSFSESESNANEFVGMDLEVLPHLLAWAGRDSIGHSPLYQILRILPSLTCFAGDSSRGKSSGLKRKWVQE